MLTHPTPGDVAVAFLTVMAAVVGVLLWFATYYTAGAIVAGAGVSAGVTALVIGAVRRDR